MSVCHIVSIMCQSTSGFLELSIAHFYCCVVSNFSLDALIGIGAYIYNPKNSNSLCMHFLDLEYLLTIVSARF